MRSYFLILVLIAGFQLLESCRNAPSDPSPGDPAPPTEEPGIPTEEPPTYRYWHLTGSVGDLPVAMELVRGKPFAPDQEAPLYEGRYFYQKVGTPIQLSGGPDSTGQLVLTEWGADNQPTGTFSGKLTADGSFSGVWKTPTGARQLDFRLISSEQTVEMEPLLFVDSLFAVPGKEDTPMAYISQAWLLPTGDAPWRDFLLQAFRESILGDSLASLYPTPEAAFNYRKEVFFAFFREAYEEEGEDQLGPGYSEDLTMEVLYNDGHWLTIGYAEYTYTGGAHGNYGTQLVTYDLDNQRIFQLSDILKPGYEQGIRPELVAGIRAHFELAPDESLGDYLFEDEVLPNDNFGLTGGGILFDYPPYEIAAYAAGEIQAFIPFSKIKKWLQPDFASRLPQ